MKKALIINEGHAGNLGDTAIDLCLRHVLAEFGYEGRHACFSGCKGGVAKKGKVGPYRPCREGSVLTRWRRALWPTRTLWTLAHLRRILAVLRGVQGELVVLGGGEMLQPNGVFPWALLLWTALARRAGCRNCVWVGVGVSSGMGLLDRTWIRLAAGLCDAVYVRDPDSKRRFDELLGREACRSMPDLAFILPEVIGKSECRPRETVACPAAYDFYCRKQRRNTPMSYGEYEEWWIRRLDRQMKSGDRVTLVCTGPRRDAEFQAQLAAKLAERTGQAVEARCPSTVEELARCLSVETVLSGRMHALIIGYSLGARPVAFVTSEKIAAYAGFYFAEGARPEQWSLEIRAAIRGLLEGLK